MLSQYLKCGGPYVVEIFFYDFLEVSSVREILKNEQGLFKPGVLQATAEHGQFKGCGECLELGTYDV